MPPVRWETEVNRLFTSLFDTPTTARVAPAPRRWTPALDLVETAETYVLRADLPGLTREAVSIDVEHRTLTIAGERLAPASDERQGFARYERPAGAFRRSVTLPEGVDATAITASLTDGVLEVGIPKPVQAQPRKIEIAAAPAPAVAVAPEEPQAA